MQKHTFTITIVSDEDISMQTIENALYIGGLNTTPARPVQSGQPWVFELTRRPDEDAGDPNPHCGMRKCKLNLEHTHSGGAGFDNVARLFDRGGRDAG